MVAREIISPRIFGRQVILERRLEEQAAAARLAEAREQQFLEEQRIREAQVPTAKQRAFEQVVRAAQGKRTLVTRDIAKEFEQLLQDPVLRNAVETGQTIGLLNRQLENIAKKQGFESFKEFSGASRVFAGLEEGKVVLKKQDFEKIKGLQQELEKITVEKKTPERLKQVIRKAVIEPIPIPKQEGVPKRFDFVKSFIKKVSDKIGPKSAKGVIGFFDLDKPVVQRKDIPVLSLIPKIPEIAVDITTPTGPGTTVVLTPRLATFFEKFDLDEKDKSARLLKIKVENINGKFDQGLITEFTANRQLDTAINEFTKSEIIKGVPANFALGFGLAISRLIPFVGPLISTGVGAVLAADFFLKRDEVVKQFRQFPKESSASLGAFIAGGLVGGAGVRLKGTKGPTGSAKINLENLRSSTFIKGKLRDQIVKKAEEILPDVIKFEDVIKDTGTIVSNIVLKDGRRFNVIQFEKEVAGKISTEFIGLEVAPKVAERFVGRAVGVRTPEGAETFIQAIKFRQGSSKFSSILNKLRRGQIIDIAERTEIIKTGRFGQLRAVEIRSVASLLRTAPARIRVLREIKTLLERIRKGENLSILQLKKIINLDKALKGEKPFTEAEFRSADVRAISDATLIKTLGDVQIRITQLPREGILSGQQISALIGVAEVVPGIVKKPVPIKKVPLAVTFGREAPIVTRGRQLLKTKPFQKLKPIKKTKQEQRIASTISPAAFSIIAAVPFEQQFSRVPPFSGGSFGLGLFLSPKTIQQDLISVKNRIGLLNQQISRLKTVTIVDQTLRINQLNQQKTRLIFRQQQLLSLKVKLQQRTRQGLKTQTTTKLRPFIPKLPLLPPVKIPKEKVKKKPKVRVKIKEAGYNTFVKSKGKFRKQNIVPITKKKAQNLGSFLVDKSTSRTFEIKLAKKKAQKPKLRVPPKYFEKNIRKFRGKKIKGKIQPIKNLAIEKIKFAIDSRGEKRQLSAARIRARLFKAFKKRKKK